MVKGSRKSVKNIVSVVARESQLEELAAAVVKHLQATGRANLCVFLHGNLGMGKTTLSKAIIRSLGFEGRVKSPTYTLVEPYELETIDVYHFDLYRLSDPEELEFMGARDYFESGAEERPRLCIVEWPEKGEGCLPSPDLEVSIDVTEKGRIYEIKAYGSENNVLCDMLRDSGMSLGK